MIRPEPFQALVTMISLRVVRGILISAGLLSFTGCIRRIPQEYTGQWLLHASGCNMMLLRTEIHGAHIQGELFQPKHFTEEPDGSFIDVTQPMITRPLSGRKHGKTIRIQIGAGTVDSGSLSFHKPDQLDLDFFHGIVPAWTFVRLKPGDRPTIKTDWPMVTVDPQLAAYQLRLKSEADKDKTARNSNHFNDAEMMRIAAEALPLLDEVFRIYGWPNISTFGVEAAENFWLLVQHQEPDTQRRMITSLQLAVSAGEAEQSEYAYLFDRVQVNDGKPQHWGTQSRCERGHAILYSLDATIHEVNARRRLVGLNDITGKESETLCHHASR